MNVTSSIPAVASNPPPKPPDDNPFRYGWRYVRRIGPDGQGEDGLILGVGGEIIGLIQHGTTPKTRRWRELRVCL